MNAYAPPQYSLATCDDARDVQGFFFGIFLRNDSGQESLIFSNKSKRQQITFRVSSDQRSFA